MVRTFLLLLLLLPGTGISLHAQRFSYLYIQGDKQIPFYVKLNGEMQPRYGKNYCILPQLEEGTIKLEIFFQQNAYPAQQFTVKIPANSYRAFMLTRRDGAFSLYDLHQHFYLPAGNNESADHLPAPPQQAIAATMPPKEKIVVVNQEPIEENVKAQAPPGPEKTKEPHIRKKDVKERRPVQTKPVNDVEGNDEPRFLDVTLQNDHRQEKRTASTTPQITDTVFTLKKPLAASFRNSDCPQPLPDEDFERIYKAMMQKATDEDRVGYLNSQLDKCYQTWQARTLGTMLSEDAARFTFLKNVYPHITDQQAFPLLDDMLRSEVWKTQFAQLTYR
jgi:hypothetical protein